MSETIDLHAGLSALRMMRKDAASMQQWVWTQPEVKQRGTFPDFNKGLSLLDSVIEQLESGEVSTADAEQLRNELKTYPVEWVIQSSKGIILANSVMSGTGFKFLCPSIDFLEALIETAR